MHLGHLWRNSLRTCLIVSVSVLLVKLVLRKATSFEDLVWVTFIVFPFLLGVPGISTNL